MLVWEYVRIRYEYVGLFICLAAYENLIESTVVLHLNVV